MTRPEDTRNAAWFVSGLCCGCGADTVRPGHFAGRECWFRLPKEIRDVIWSTWRRGDIDGWQKAADEAVAWFAEHPLEPTGATGQPEVL